MRHLVVLDVVSAGDTSMVVFGALDTAAGPHPQMLDAMLVSPREAEAVGRLLRQARGASANSGNPA